MFRTLCLVAFLATAPLARAQDPNLPVPLIPFLGDDVFVPLRGGGVCSSAKLDSSRPPRISLTSHESYYYYQVEYWLNEPEVPVCAVPPGPPTFYANVGTLPEGVHYFNVTGYLDGAPHSQYQTAAASVGASIELPSDVTGLWYDPARPGRGLSVTRTEFNVLALLWFTHDATGNPHWLVSNAKQSQVGRARGVAFHTTGVPDALPQAQPPWGDLEFRYLGCGRAELHWIPWDTATPQGSQQLRKLAQDFVSERCAPRSAVAAIWGTRP